jgi:hypothetical protein
MKLEMINLKKDISFIFIVIILILNLVNCTPRKVNNKQDDVLNYALKYYHFNEKNEYEWEIDFETTGEDHTFLEGETYFGGHYGFTSQKNDTMYSIYFIMYVNENDTVFAPYWLYKRFIHDGFQHILSFGKGGDTLYHYKAELYGRLKKLFVRGEYYYLYEFNELNQYQREFFEKHRDSLTSIKGGNLPPLPNLQSYE